MNSVCILWLNDLFDTAQLTRKCSLFGVYNTAEDAMISAQNHNKKMSETPLNWENKHGKVPVHHDDIHATNRHCLYRITRHVVIDHGEIEQFKSFLYQKHENENKDGSQNPTPEPPPNSPSNTPVSPAPELPDCDPSGEPY